MEMSIGLPHATWLTPQAGDALLLVDLQRDFMSGGALAVPGAESVLAPLNSMIALFVARQLPVFASRDWHPPDHGSFQSGGGPWPAHCVAGSPGASFAPGLNLPRRLGLVSKGCQAGQPGYSALSATDLEHRLHKARVRRLFVGGLATDYCVLRTVLDARALGFQVVVLRDGVASVDREPGDGERALERMQRAGALLVGSSEVLA